MMESSMKINEMNAELIICHIIILVETCDLSKNF